MPMRHDNQTANPIDPDALWVSEWVIENKMSERLSLVPHVAVRELHRLVTDLQTQRGAKPQLSRWTEYK